MGNREREKSNVDKYELLKIGQIVPHLKMLYVHMNERFIVHVISIRGICREILADSCDNFIGMLKIPRICLKDMYICKGRLSFLLHLSRRFPQIWCNNRNNNSE